MYYPVLRWMAGEKKAIKNIENTFYDTLVPIWWITDEDKDDNFIAEVDKIWAGESVVDLSNRTNPSIFINTLIDSSDHKFLKILITIDQYALFPAALQSKIDDRFCLKVPFADDCNVAYHQRIVGSIKSQDVNIAKTTIIFDIGFVDDESYAIASDIGQIINMYCSLGFQNLIFCSGAFPGSLASLGVGLAHIPRSDKNLYELVSPSVNNELQYSDYGILNPNWTPGFGRPKTNIRYALDDSWMILRDNDSGADSAFAIAGLLISTSEFAAYGQGFSWGDKCWHSKFTTKTKPGGPTEHVAESLNHHMMQVLMRS